MITGRILNPAVLATKLASLATILAIIVGVMVLVGWAFDIAVLKSILPGWVAMKANAAVCFILIGVALWLTARQHSAHRTLHPAILLARLCGLLAGLIGLLTLGEYIFGWNPGIDQWLVREAAGAVGTSDPGRMAPETALCFVLLAAALWITGSSRKTRWTILASVNFGLLVTTLALAAMLSYLTPGLGPYGWFGLTIMAMHTSVLFAMLGMAVIAISWQQDILPWSLGRNTTVALACGMALLVFIGLSINRSQFWLVDTNIKIAHSEEVLNNTKNLQVELAEAHAHARGYIITGDERFLKSYLEAIADYNKKMGTLRQLIAGSPHQQQQASLIETNVDLLQRWTQQFIDAPRTGMTNTTRSKIGDHGGDLLDNIRITFNKIENEHQQFIRGLKQEAESVARFSYITIATGTFASLLIFLTVIFRLNFAVNERQSKELALQESEEKFRKITESAQDAIIMMGADQCISFWNAAATRVFGYTAAEAIGQELHTLIVPAPAHAGFAQAFPHFQETGGGPIIGKVRELTALRKGGEEFTVELSVSATQLSGQWYAIGIVRDISARKHADEVLRNSEAEFRTLAEAMPQIVWITRPDGWNIYFNQQWMDYTGLTLEESMGHGWNKPFHPDDQQRAWDAWQQATATNGIYSIESRLRRADGVYRWWLVRGVPLQDADGNILKWFGTCTDINDMKMAGLEISRINLELRESEQRLDLALESGHMGVWDLDLIHDTSWRSLQHDQIFGYESLLPEWGQAVFMQHVVPEDRDRISQCFEEALRTNRLDFECKITRRDQDQRWIYVRGQLYRDEMARPVHMMGTIMDITERKRLELDKEQYLKFFILSINPMCIADPYGCFMQVNPAFVKLTGYSESELIAKPFLDFVLPEDRQRTEDEMKLQVEERPTLHFDNRYLCKDGSVIDLSWTAYYDKHDGISYATAIDTTERKRAEASLRQLSLAVEQSPSSIDITDLEANIEYVNAAFVRTSGYSVAELIGQNPRLLQSGKTPRASYADMWAHLTRGEAWHGEFINRRKDGTEYIESALVSPVRQPDGNVTHYLAIKDDITDRKRMESELTEQLDELRRWHDVTSGREGRILDLKHEVNKLLAQAGRPPRYPSAEAIDETEK